MCRHAAPARPQLLDRLPAQKIAFVEFTISAGQPLTIMPCPLRFVLAGASAIVAAWLLLSGKAPSKVRLAACGAYPRRRQSPCSCRRCGTNTLTPVLRAGDGAFGCRSPGRAAPLAVAASAAGLLHWALPVPHFLRAARAGRAALSAGPGCSRGMPLHAPTRDDCRWRQWGCGSRRKLSWAGGSGSCSSGSRPATARAPEQQQKARP